MSEENLIKIKLLSDGGYGCADKVDFPVEVMAKRFRAGFSVHRKELERVGFNSHNHNPDYDLYFSSSEVEVISDELIEEIKTKPQKQPKHRPNVSNENYDSVMTFEGKTFNEKLSSVFSSRTKLIVNRHNAELRNNELEAKLGVAQSEAAYSDNRLLDASKEIMQLKCDKAAINKKLSSANESIIGLNKEIDCLLVRLEVKRTDCKEQSETISELNEILKVGTQQFKEVDVKRLSLEKRLSTESARAARYKFTTAIYGLCTIGFLIGWICA